jgi:large subunit ribosomal protein L22
MKVEEKGKKLAIAKLKYLNIAPRKTRKIVDTIRGLSVLEAESELLFRPQRAAKPILKLLRSAFSNIKDKNIKKEKLFIDEVRVDKGPVRRKSLPKARGRATRIEGKSSHIFLSLSDLGKKLPKRKYKIPNVKMIKSDKFVSRFKKEEKEEVKKETEISKTKKKEKEEKKGKR